MAVRLLDQNAQPFALDGLRGQTVVLNFIFTHCPSVCPTQTRALTRVQAQLPTQVRERVQFVSVSIDPERDTPAVMADFSRKLGVDLSHWSFVTGTQAAIAELNQAYSAQALPEGASAFDHRSEVRLIGPSGKLLMTYVGRPLDEPRLAREIQTVDRMFRRTASR